MTHTVTLDIPEQGQLVEMRQRRYVVTDIESFYNRRRRHSALDYLSPEAY